MSRAKFLVFTIKGNTNIILCGHCFLLLQIWSSGWELGSQPKAQVLFPHPPAEPTGSRRG